MNEKGMRKAGRGYILRLCKANTKEITVLSHSCLALLLLLVWDIVSLELVNVACDWDL